MGKEITMTVVSKDKKTIEALNNVSSSAAVAHTLILPSGKDVNWTIENVCFFELDNSNKVEYVGYYIHFVNSSSLSEYIAHNGSVSLCNELMKNLKLEDLKLVAVN